MVNCGHHRRARLVVVWRMASDMHHRSLPRLVLGHAGTGASARGGEPYPARGHRAALDARRQPLAQHTQGRAAGRGGEGRGTRLLGLGSLGELVLPGLVGGLALLEQRLGDGDLLEQQERERARDGRQPGWLLVVAGEAGRTPSGTPRARADENPCLAAERCSDGPTR